MKGVDGSVYRVQPETLVLAIILLICGSTSAFLWEFTKPVGETLLPGGVTPGGDALPNFLEVRASNAT